MWSTTQTLKKVYLRIYDTCNPSRRHLVSNLKYCAQLTPPTRLLLDLGCGPGTYYHYFEFSQFVSLDLDAYHQPSIQGDVRFLPLKDGVAQTVLFTEVLEHLSKPEQALSEIWRVMTPGGYLSLSVPFVFGMHGEDYHRWTKLGLTQLTENHGFEMVWIKECGGPFAAIANILVFLPLELFTPSSARERELSNWPKYLTHFAGLVILAPLTFLLLAIDSIYPRKNFTSGYVALLKKPPESAIDPG